MSGERSPDSARKGERATQHLDDDLIFKFINGLVDAKDKQTVYEHLSLCHDCAYEVAAIAKFALNGPTAEEKLALQKFIEVDAEAELGRVMAQAKTFYPTHFPETKKTKPRPVNAGQRVWDWWASLSPIPRYVAFALSVVVLGLFIANRLFRSDFTGYYVYDDKLPYDYNVSSLRGASSDLESDSLFQASVRQFKLGMSDYVIYDYEGTIRLLQDLEPAVRLLEARADDEIVLPWLRDYYFYRGVSHFALARSQRLSLSVETKRENLTAAICWLEHAGSLVAAHHLDGDDRETYFLGLAYGFGGQRDSAMVQLHQIKAGSQFYGDTVKLIHEWSNE